MSTKDIHIEWIDGAKGVAILSVILLHSLPCLREIGWMWHIGQAVPVFLFITAYLISIRFKSLKTYFTWERFLRMLKKVFIPFAIVLFLQLFLFALAGRHFSLRDVAWGGGIGPGSYYIWLYIAVWIIVPFIVLLVRKVPIWASMIIMLIVSVVAEFFFYRVQYKFHAEELYRLLPVRYMMVIYLGCIWNKVNKWQKYILYGLACVSAVLILRDIYFVDCQTFANTPPVFLKSPFWGGYHWYTAFYVIVPITLLERIKYMEIWKQAGKYSWYIFLLQMMCLSFV